ncbi:SurA N-terminal domain-containing protein [Pseudooceanicola sp. MF1-13]|uniref:peptidylprolyl isomerase n=1 Tax=Pseudooceanicola sp. MF1-13 TaxID=3379095 RepID=UPI0038929666
MASKTGKTAGKTAMWVLMGLLILGLGGFGATSFTGNVRSVGSVGDQDIGVNEYARALQNEIRAFEAQTGSPMSLEQAQALGLDRRVLSQLVTNAAMDDEAARIGLSVGDETLAKQVQTIPAFQGVDGQFDRDAYRFAIDQTGMSESEFESGLRDETARTLLQGAVISGSALPASYVDTVLTYFAERRRVTWVRVDASQLEGDSYEPSDEDLMTLYENQIEDFTLPERKVITYAWLTPEMIIDQVELDEELLRQEYEARSAQYNIPERRLVERLIYSDQGRAEVAQNQLNNGSMTFEGLVEERGLSLGDVDLGDVTQADLGEAGEQVFAAESGDVVGPIETSLGPAFFRVNGVLAAEETTYEEALPDLRQELAFDRARRIVTNMSEPAEDLLAGGATLEDLAAETDLMLGNVDWAEGQSEGIAAYEGFDAAAAALTADDYPEIMQLDDGGIYAMRLDDVLPPEPVPFAEVRDRVRSIWETRRQMERLRAVAEDMMGKLGEAADFASLGLEVNSEEALTRQSSVLGAPEEFVEKAFQMETGEIAMVDGFGAVLILKLEEILPPNMENPDVAAARNSLEQQLQSSVAQDVYRLFSENVRSRAGAEIDQQAINAVHVNFQ